MEEEGMVSVWIGQATDEDDWYDLFEATYTDDDEFLGSAFSRAFGIDGWDEDFQERSQFGRSNARLEHLLAGVSYANVVVPRIAELSHGVGDDTDNVAMLLYNVAYPGTVSSWNFGTASLRFVGVVRYR
jgi:hypothetical protein